MNENLSFGKLSVVEQFGQSMRGSSVCGGKYHLFGLARVNLASEDKERQLCELHKVVSTCGPNGIRNSEAVAIRGSVN